MYMITCNLSLSPQSLGQVGRIIKVQGNGDVRVAVNGKRWIMNPRCMVPAPNLTPPEDNLGLLDSDNCCMHRVVHTRVCLSHFSCRRD